MPSFQGGSYMRTADTMGAAPHPSAALLDVCNSAALLDVCNSAALRSPIPARKAAAGSWKINAINNLLGPRPELLFITSVVREHAVLVTTR
jgi:hypothetical protein